MPIIGTDTRVDLLFWVISLDLADALATHEFERGAIS